MSSNLPPGVTAGMIEEQSADRPCDVCGYMPDGCVCPECPVCGEQGNPQCYKELSRPFPEGHQGIKPAGSHGLELSITQLIGRSKSRIAYLEDQIADEGMYLDWLEEQKLEEEQKENRQ